MYHSWRNILGNVQTLVEFHAKFSWQFSDDKCCHISCVFTEKNGCFTLSIMTISEYKRVYHMYEPLWKMWNIPKDFLREKSFQNWFFFNKRKTCWEMTVKFHIYKHSISLAKWAVLQKNLKKRIKSSPLLFSKLLWKWTFAVFFFQPWFLW